MVGGYRGNAHDRSEWHPQRWYILLDMETKRKINPRNLCIIELSCSEWRHATTSAELKLLRLRLTLLNPGRADFVAGTTTADALFVIHASDAVPARLTVAFATSLKDDV